MANPIYTLQERVYLIGGCQGLLIFLGVTRQISVDAAQEGLSSGTVHTNINLNFV